MALNEQHKQAVRARAGNCCEYCRVAQDGRLARFHVDHIVAIKHGGTDSEANLCLACPECNAYKGDNVAAIDPMTDAASKLYHPRQQSWDEHFRLNADATISGTTSEGRTTVAVLRFNDPKRVTHRLAELAVGDYPC